tara:strand:- start:1066 stop:1746 length:681 start_codon:yes stop_codon:yes gene_type:complete
MYKKTVIFLLIIYTSIPFSFAIEPYVAEYKFIKNSIKFAESQHSLKKHELGWSINSSTEPSGILNLFYKKRTENSFFTFNDDIFKTIEYSFINYKSDDIEKVITKSNSNILISIINDVTEKEHSKGYVIDRLVAQLFGYKFINLDNVQVIDKGRERKYNFKQIATENISTILGDTRTIVVEKNISGSKRKTLTWYAIDFGYVPVKIEQYRLSNLKFSANLTKYIKK